MMTQYQDFNLLRYRYTIFQKYRDIDIDINIFTRESSYTAFSES